MKNKELQLENLFKEMLQDKKLPFSSNLVFAEGSAEAEVVFIGEAPGAKEDELLKPFVGRSGKLLTESLKEISLERNDVYITNIVKRRPPDNRDPNLQEIAAYKPYLDRQLAIIKPKIIVTLGRFALNYFLPAEKITQAQGKVFLVANLKILVMFHPAAALRRKKLKEEFKNSFKVLQKLLADKKKTISK